MKNFLRIFDFYGAEFHWYFEYKPKYYTFSGGIFTILSFILYIIVFIMFGLEDFKRTNPISNISNIPPLLHKTVQFGKQNLYLPWRIMDYNKKFIDFDGILFPKIYYFTNKFNEQTGIMETFHKMLNYTLCNETSMKYLGNNFLIDIPLNDLYCIEMDNINMGGSWDSDFVNYIHLDLNLCKDGIDYDESNINCTSTKFVNSIYDEGNNWFFELLYPSVQFQPLNKTMPFLVLYTPYYYGLSINSNKVDRIYLQEHIFEDEKGWIFNKITNISYWGVSAIKSDFYTIGERDIFRYGSTSRLYSLKLYIDFSTILYSRKYKKLFEIISELFPIFRCISSLFSSIVLMFKKLEIAKKLNEYIIGNEINRFKNKEKERRFKSIKLSYNYGPNEIDANLNFKRKISKLVFNNSKIPIGNKNSSNAELIDITKINKNEKEKQRRLSRKLSTSHYLNTKPSNNYNNIKSACMINSDIFEKFDRKKPNFPFHYYLYASFLNKIYSKKKHNYLCISEQFDLSYTLFTHIIDITLYISLYKQFEAIKALLLKDNSLKSENNKIDSDLIKIKTKNIKLLRDKFNFEG